MSDSTIIEHKGTKKIRTDRLCLRKACIERTLSKNWCWSISTDTKINGCLSGRFWFLTMVKNIYEK